MQPVRVSKLLVLTCLIALGSAAHAAGATVEGLLTAAKKEGVIELYAPSTFTPQGAQALGDAFNKKYELKIRVNYSPAGQMARDVSKVVTAAAAGMAPEWDLMVVTDAHHATLWLKKQHKAFDYSKIGVDPRAVQYDSGTVILANQFVLPAYNKKVLPPLEVPKKWEDLLDPKWKGGKLGMSTATHHLARLATLWGEKKATEFAKALAATGTLPGRTGRDFQPPADWRNPACDYVDGQFHPHRENHGRADRSCRGYRADDFPRLQCRRSQRRSTSQRGPSLRGLSNNARGARGLTKIRRPHLRVCQRHTGPQVCAGQEGVIPVPRSGRARGQA
jgi:hypothetical protein